VRAVVTDRPGSFRMATTPRTAPAQVPGPALLSNLTCEATSLAYAIRRIDDGNLAAIQPTERNVRCWS
jgi:hypothetical protein